MQNPAIRRLSAATLLLAAAAAQAQGQGTVYKCPGTPVLYTDQLSSQQARERGCSTIEGAPITIVQSPRIVRPASGAGAGDSRVDPAEQRSRDNDARRILGDELQREEARLAALQKDYNNGQPERQGGERNYQRYLDRVAEMKAAIARKEADIAALRRELSKHSP